MSWYRQHKQATWISVGALVVVLLAGGTMYFVQGHEGSKARTETQAKKQAEVVRVRIAHPKTGGIERLVKRPATVRPFEHADLYAKVSGFLENQKVDIGSRVEKGELLAQVYAPEKQKDVEKAAADLKKAKADLEAMKATSNKAEADQLAAQSRYEQAKSDVKRAEAMLDLRRKQYRRYYNLARENAIQQELVDEKEEARLAAEAAKAASEKALATALSEVEAAKAGVVQARADVGKAEAAVDVAKAAWDRAKVYEGYTRILSPYTGVITKRSFHNGDFVRDASSGGVNGREAFPILAVARTDKMRLVIEVPDRDVPYLTVGAPVNLIIDTLPSRHFQGKVARMSYQEAYDTRTMRTEVDLENPDGLLKDGMFGWMTIHLGREKGLRIPSKCLVGNEKGDTRSVYVVRDDKAHKVKVEIGRDDGIEVTISKGLDQTDEVILDRPSSLGDGFPVEVIHDGEDDAEKEERSRQEVPRSQMPESTNNQADSKESKNQQ